MLSYIWNTFFFNPLYNLLVFFIGVVRDGDLGLAIIATVLVVKILLLPLSIKAAKTQKTMREIEPKLKAIKEEHKDDKEAQVKAIMAIYKEAGMNPFSVLLNILIQLPILIALYLSIYSNYQSDNGIATFVLNPDRLYSFIPFPGESFSTMFLGTIDMLGQNLLLALLAGLTAYVQMRYTMPQLPPRSDSGTPDLKDEFMRSMQLQMRYVMPLIMVGIGYFFSAVIAIYLIVSNVAALLQEWYVRGLQR